MAAEKGWTCELRWNLQDLQEISKAIQKASLETFNMKSALIGPFNLAHIFWFTIARQQDHDSVKTRSFVTLNTQPISPLDVHYYFLLHGSMFILLEDTQRNAWQYYTCWFFQYAQ